ncbi:MAG: S9 family peptidase [Candidatus Neomarinimicrobiota bacterium]|nr:S9 family peptidase [Candidatus Neomarinimicrobiota bacterium]
MTKTDFTINALFLGIMIVGIIMTTFNHTPSPPVAKMIPKDVTIHDDKRIDPYYWLKERDTKPVLDYLNAENNYTIKQMKHTERLQDELYGEMRARIKEDDSTVPYKFMNYIYYTRTEEDNQYDVYCRKRGSMDEKEEITVDLNKLAEKVNYLTLGSHKISPNEKMVAFTIDTSGSERYKLIIKNIQSGEILDKNLTNLEGPIEWANDNITLFYTILDDAHRPHQLWRHTLGNKQSQDSLVYQEKDERFFVGLHRTKSGAFLKMELESNITSEVHLLDRNDPLGEWQVFQPREQEVEYYVYHHGDYFYQITNKNAINFKLIRKRLNGDGEEELIPNRETTFLDNLTMFKDHMAVLERVNGKLEIRIFDFNSESWTHLEMDEEIYSLFFDANYDFNADFLRVGYGSFITPYSVYDIDFKTQTKTLRKREDVLGGYDPNNYKTERIWAPTHDGKQVAISLLYRKNVDLKGNNPCFLNGYGSYGSTYDPWFSSRIISLVDRGVVFARAHIRGSSYLGRQWYLDGRLMNKKNTFEDFISVGKYLSDENVTSPGKLAIHGGSAGGLLIGAVLNMEPDMCAVAVADVPFVDVINTMLDETIPLTVIEFEEWGNPKEKEFYEYMKSYSPYDNVEAKDYPHIMVLAGYNDPRVMYWEPAKWTAKLRTLKTDSNDLLMKTEMQAGHFSSSGRFDYLKDVAFYYAFVLDKLGIN